MEKCGGMKGFEHNSTGLAEPARAGGRKAPPSPTHLPRKENMFSVGSATPGHPPADQLKGADLYKASQPPTGSILF